MISSIPELILLLLMGFQPGAHDEQSIGVAAAKSVSGTTQARTLSYVMRGEVRLLFFWVGRDNVGGGKISLRVGPENTIGRSWKEVEVLFGSNPERVPGKANMWGYGRERSCWKLDEDGQEVVGSLFEGFMRPKEDFPAEMRDYMRAHKNKGSFLYKAVRSEVSENRATTEIRYFIEKEEFNYRSPEKLLRRYQETITSTPPQITRELPRRATNDETPAGFLTAVQSLVDRISDEAARNAEGWTGFTPSILYAFHAKPYLLSVRKAVSAVKFRAALAERSSAALPNVAEVEFHIRNLKDATECSFTLWFALDGEMQGLPLRIVYQPKWWLRLRLDLTLVTSHE